MAKRVLIVALEPLPDAAVRESLGGLAGTEDVEAHVVSPASKVSRIQWLTNEEDQARERAGEIADETAAAVGQKAASVESEAGDVDPLQAAEDALRSFHADEIVVLCRPGEHESWLERESLDDGFERFGLPVTYARVGN